MRLGMAQINPTVGNLSGNTEKIMHYIDKARELGIDLLTFPELAITGYPPEGLVLKPQFIKQNQKCLEEIVSHTADIAVIVGFIDSNSSLYNAAALMHNNYLDGIYHKVHLPDYDIFDETSYFQAGTEYPVFVLYGIGVGITISNDMWYEFGPATVQAHSGAELLINISATPCNVGKRRLRERMLATRASDNVAIVAHNNLVGGQDEMVFDGNSLIINEKGEIVARGKQFEEDLVVADLDLESLSRSRWHGLRHQKEAYWIKKELEQANRIEVPSKYPPGVKSPLPPRQVKELDELGEIYQALVLGTRDYIIKNGFEKVVIGLSGGIDSSLTATIAVDALGANNVIGVSMPSRYSAPDSKSDAEALAQNLGIDLKVIPIEKAFKSYLSMLEETFQGTEVNEAEENIQARIRGNILMALSNKFGWLVLACSNKSEVATGYTTLYGDMAGGFSPLKDVPKTMVVDLVKYKNRQAGKEIVPANVINKSPSAELKANQKDTDALPPYKLLDLILKAYLEDNVPVDQIITMGFSPEMVVKAIHLVDRSEYKRRQSPPGIKITTMDIRKEKKLPITNQFQEHFRQ